VAQFVLSPEARDDLREIRGYIARDSSEAAQRVLTELRTAMRRLAEMPQMGHLREDLVAELSISGSPEVERRPRDAEVPASLVDVPHALGVLEDSLLPMNLSLLVGHTDLLGHPGL
jgi:plasmid stabilization system protein ParE